jgi:hypothetical protein
MTSTKDWNYSSKQATTRPIGDRCLDLILTELAEDQRLQIEQEAQRMIQGSCRRCGHTTPKWRQPRALQALTKDEANTWLRSANSPVPTSYERLCIRRSCTLVELRCLCEQCQGLATARCLKPEWDRRTPAAVSMGFAVALTPISVFSVVLYFLIDVTVIGILQSAYNWPIIAHGRYLRLKSSCAVCGGTRLTELPDRLWRKCRCPQCGELSLAVDPVLSKS